MIANYTDHAANERTFLAWVRTAIAIVGFGLAFSRLGPIAPNSIWSEVALLLSGAFVVLVAFLRMRHVRAKISDPKPQDDDALPADALLLLLVAGLFVMMTVFVIHIG